MITFDPRSERIIRAKLDKGEDLGSLYIRFGPNWNLAVTLCEGALRHPVTISFPAWVERKYVEACRNTFVSLMLKGHVKNKTDLRVFVATFKKQVLATVSEHAEIKWSAITGNRSDDYIAAALEWAAKHRVIGSVSRRVAAFDDARSAVIKGGEG